MLLAELANQRLGLGRALEHGREQVLVFLRMMVAIEEPVDVGQKPVKHRQLGSLAAVDFLDQFFQAVQHRAEIEVLAFDDLDRAHEVPPLTANGR